MARRGYFSKWAWPEYDGFESGRGYSRTFLECEDSHIPSFRNSNDDLSFKLPLSGEEFLLA